MAAKESPEQKPAAERKEEGMKHIRALQAKRDEALGRGDYKEAKQYRRGIRTVKRRVRVLVRVAKAEAAAAPPAAS